MSRKKRDLDDEREPKEHFCPWYEVQCNAVRFPWGEPTCGLNNDPEVCVRGLKKPVVEVSA